MSCGAGRWEVGRGAVEGAVERHAEAASATATIVRYPEVVVILSKARDLQFRRARHPIMATLGHDRENETIVPLAADCLNGRRGNPSVASDALHGTPHSLYADVLGVRVDHFAVSHYIVDDDE